jgi:hypothetical protein
LRFFAIHDSASDQAEEVSPNANKDKMMASIVVNLRMNDPALQRRVRTDALFNRDSETDLSMTNTDATSSPCNPQDMSVCSAEDFEDEITELSDSEPHAYNTADYSDYCTDQNPENDLLPKVRRRHAPMNS